MTPQQVNLARRRLQLGISNVGFWVLTSALGLYWLCHGDTGGFDMPRLGFIFLAAVAVQSVFDFIGGAVLMVEPRPSVTKFFQGWLRGSLVHTLVLTGAGFLSYANFFFSGGFSFAIFLSMVALAVSRWQLLQAVAGVTTADLLNPEKNVLTVNVDDPAFTGGITGFGPSAKSLLPARWLAMVPPEELAAESGRRQWQIENGLPIRVFLMILFWNLLGGFVGAFLFQLAKRSPAEALLGFACWMTLWAFAGLLVLPALSRKAVLAADQAVAVSGLDPRGWIKRFPSFTGEDGSSSPTVQTIFYPIPSSALRLQQLEQPVSGFVLGNLARNNLYYSWATLTLLGRSVHCNVGRPALWIFPPSA